MLTLGNQVKRRGSNHSGVRARPRPISESFGIPVPYNGQVVVTEGVPIATVSGWFPGREVGATKLDIVLKNQTSSAIVPLCQVG